MRNHSAAAIPAGYVKMPTREALARAIFPRGWDETAGKAERNVFKTEGFHLADQVLALLAEDVTP